MDTWNRLTPARGEAVGGLEAGYKMVKGLNTHTHTHTHTHILYNIV